MPTKSHFTGQLRCQRLLGLGICSTRWTWKYLRSFWRQLEARLSLLISGPRMQRCWRIQLDEGKFLKFVFVVTRYIVDGYPKLIPLYAVGRVGFKQTYYCVKAFMRQRKFPNILATRVLDYYNLQWRAHEGTLIPTERSVVWDAPESILQSVTMEQAQTFFARVPLVQVNTPRCRFPFPKEKKGGF